MTGGDDFLSITVETNSKLLIQWKPLNGITLGQKETDSNNRLIIIRERTKHTLATKWKFGI
jgi:hypothetical protein